MNAAIEDKVSEIGFGEIEQFNNFAREHPDVLSATMRHGASVEELLTAANRLGFAISTDQVNAYIASKMGRSKMLEEHFPLAPGVFCSTTVTITTTAAIATTVAVGNTVALGEVVVYAVVDIVVAAVAVAWAVV